jgi:hypothetical protein
MPTTDRRPLNADCRLPMPTTDRRPLNADRRRPTADR